MTTRPVYCDVCRLPDLHHGRGSQFCTCDDDPGWGDLDSAPCAPATADSTSPPTPPPATHLRSDQ
ncbi:hypothetical protein HCB18_24370 [Salinispora arenicola]|nr:hypothetical protein [Salinispora arenicola]